MPGDELPANEHFDLFICHASEDKEQVATPLAQALLDRGLRVWLDELELTIGDSLHGRIDAALAKSRFGVVVISPAFFAKKWPQRELAGLAARELDAGAKVILPVWHDVDHHFIAQRSPILADRLGALTSDGLHDVANKIALALQRAGAPVSPAIPLPSADVADTPARARRNGVGRLGGAGLAVALAATVGFGLAPGGSSPGASEPLLGSAANQAIEVSLPAGWRPTQALPATPGVRLTESLSLRSPSAAGALAIGGVESTSATLLPTGLLSLLSAPPRHETVHLGTGSFYRYRKLEPRGANDLETLYATPTSTGILLGVCVLPKRSELLREANCERILSSLRSTTAVPIPLGPQAVYARTLSTAFSGLNAARTRLGGQLAAAKTATSQATLATRLAQAHEQAAAALGHATPGPSERIAGRSILAALHSIARGYTAMAAGAREQSPRAFELGSTAVSAGTSRLSKAVAQLSSFGYRVG